MTAVTHPYGLPAVIDRCYNKIELTHHLPFRGFDMNVEKLARVLMKRLIAPLFFLGIGLCSPQITSSVQQGVSTPPLPNPAQTRGRPADPQAITLEQRGDISAARKSYEDAVIYYQRAIKDGNSANAVLWNKLGIAYQQLENYPAARKAYNHAVRQQQDYAEPLNNIGTTYFMQGKYGKSVKDYLKALRLDPHSASYHLNLGTSYFHLKKFKESVEEYRTALTLNPNVFTESSATGTTIEPRWTDAEYYFYLGKVYASLGRVDDAVQSLRRALEEGFKDRKKILSDPDFMKISQNPAYVELMNNPPVAIGN